MFVSYVDRFGELWIRNARGAFYTSQLESIGGRKLRTATDVAFRKMYVYNARKYASGGNFFVLAQVSEIRKLNLPATHRFWRLVGNLLFRPKLYFRLQRLAVSSKTFCLRGIFRDRLFRILKPLSRTQITIYGGRLRKLPIDPAGSAAVRSSF